MQRCTMVQTLGLGRNIAENLQNEHLKHVLVHALERHGIKVSQHVDDADNRNTWSSLLALIVVMSICEPKSNQLLYLLLLDERDG